MLASPFARKLRSIFESKPKFFGPAHPDSHPLYITDDLVSAAMNALTDREVTWPRDPQYRIEVIMVNIPLQYCPPHIANDMPPECQGRHPYVVAIGKARFRRTPENPGGELTEVAMIEWNQMAVTFSHSPKELVTVVPLRGVTHNIRGRSK